MDSKDFINKMIFDEWLQEQERKKQRQKDNQMLLLKNQYYDFYLALNDYIEKEFDEHIEFNELFDVYGMPKRKIDLAYTTILGNEIEEIIKIPNVSKEGYHVDVSLDLKNLEIHFELTPLCNDVDSHEFVKRFQDIQSLTAYCELTDFDTNISNAKCELIDKFSEVKELEEEDEEEL